jgi:hypothetical protein
MTATSVGQHEDIVQESRLRNKQIMLVDYKDVQNVELFSTEESRESVLVDLIKIFLINDREISFECNVVLPTNLYILFESDYFNQLIPNNRYQEFKNLVDFINRGH